jgi:hypothetical protein
MCGLDERGNNDRIAAARSSQDTVDEGQDQKVEHKYNPR